MIANRRFVEDIATHVRELRIPTCANSPADAVFTIFTPNIDNDETVMPEYFYHILLVTSPRSKTSCDPARQSKSPVWPTGVEALPPFLKRQSSADKTSSRHDRDLHCSLEASDDLEQEVLTATTQRLSFDERSPDSLSGESGDVKQPTPTQSQPLLSEDKRLDEMSVQSIDMMPPEHAARSSEAQDDQITRGIGSSTSGQRTKGKYVPLDNGASESAWGIVHLYRDADESSSLYDDVPPPKTSRSRHGGHSKETSSLGGPASDLDCTTLCILAVPSYLAPSDFLGFVGEETRDEVSHFRLIRTARANRYMVLMKFRNGKKAREWRKKWNGKVFNSMEPETCHVVFVKTVEILPSSSTLSSTTYPSMKDDPFTSASTTTSHKTTLTKPLAPRTPSLIELPTCPVCLERMDETTGLLTILCQHVFHCTCLQKWSGGGCPVCRYTHDDFTRGRGGLNNGIGACSVDDLECETCHAESNLWQCLICGKVGCGRYDAAHAFAHYEESGHSFAMDVSTQRVWDYAGDGYVHRIIQNQSDGGKLVELPARDNSALDPDWEDSVPREKLENISLEYTHLLTSQLESQRVYFEEKASAAADKATKASAAAVEASEKAESALRELAELKAKYDDLAVASVPALEKEKSRVEKRAEKFEAIARKMERDLREEKTTSKGLMERIEHLGKESASAKEDVEKLRAEKGDLEEQNRDLTFFISSSEKVKSMEGTELGDEVMQGTVGVPEPVAKGRRKGKR